MKTMTTTDATLIILLLTAGGISAETNAPDDDVAATAELAEFVDRVARGKAPQFLVARHLERLGNDGARRLAELGRGPEAQNRHIIKALLLRLASPEALEAAFSTASEDRYSRGALDDRFVRDLCEAVGRNWPGDLSTADAEPYRKAADAVLRALEHKDYGLRRRATAAVGILGLAEATELLVKRFKKDQRHRYPEMYRALAATNAMTAGAPVVEAMRTEKRPENQTDGLNCVGRIGGADGTTFLLDGLKKSKKRERHPWARALGHSRDPRARQALLDIIAHREREQQGLVYIAMQGLVTCGTREDIPLLADELQRESRDKGAVGTAAAEALGAIGTPEAIEALLGATEIRDAPTRFSVLKALARHREPRAIGAFLRYLEKRPKTPEVHRALDAFSDDLVIPPLRALWEAGDVREQAVLELLSHRIGTRSRPEPAVAEFVTRLLLASGLEPPNRLPSVYPFLASAEVANEVAELVHELKRYGKPKVEPVREVLAALELRGEVYATLTARLEGAPAIFERLPALKSADDFVGTWERIAPSNSAFRQSLDRSGRFGGTTHWILTRSSCQLEYFLPNGKSITPDPPVRFEFVEEGKVESDALQSGAIDVRLEGDRMAWHWLNKKSKPVYMVFARRPSTPPQNSVEAKPGDAPDRIEKEYLNVPADARRALLAFSVYVFAEPDQETALGAMAEAATTEDGIDGSAEEMIRNHFKKNDASRFRLEAVRTCVPREAFTSLLKLRRDVMGRRLIRQVPNEAFYDRELKVFQERLKDGGVAGFAVVTSYDDRETPHHVYAWVAREIDGKWRVVYVHRVPLRSRD